jgi:spore germination cell wall hydrolase CwlJ-like protein
VRSWRAARLISGRWRDLLFYWQTRERTELVFFAVLALPIAVLGFVIFFYFAQQDDNQDLTCLALNIYHEARGEPMAGQYAVAEVTMNRVASRRYPDTVCQVVYQKNWDRIRRRDVAAFSWTEFDSIARPEGIAWRRAWQAAEAVYYEQQAPRLKGALLYHSRYIKPSWARGKKPVARIGKHIFYR